MGLNPGVGYTGSNLGNAYGFSIDQSVDWLSRNLGRQFECTLSGDQVGGESEYYLQVRKGLVEFDHYVTDDKGILDIDALGGFNDVNVQNMFLYMNKFNVFETDKRVAGDNNETSDFISDGYIKLEKEKNYFVFIYKTTPDWQPEGSLYEARAPQIGVAADDSEANLFIKTKRSGGSFLQSYLKFAESETIENLVTADAISGKIAEFNPAEFLNDYINFDTDLLDIVRSAGQGANHPDRYPDATYPGMATWIGSGFVPVFANPSSLPGASGATPDGMTINSVPYGDSWSDSNEEIIGVNGEVTIPVVGSDAVGPISVFYATDTGLNHVAIEIIKGWNVEAKYGYDANPLVSGLLNVNDLTIEIHGDAAPESVIYFDDTEVDIIASTQTSATIPGAMTVEGTGFVVTDCYRQDIAYIKWDEELNRFKIYQMQYGPIKLRQNPLGPFKTKLLTGEEEADWGEGFDLCADMTGSLSGYTKDLNEANDVSQPPSYAGEENIGGYQSPKETL
jgi:hypothetical protein